ncbi:MAG: ABC transporter permease [Candidatus Rokubacteria bacterium]|nr:ABC transporter permease [Candidatus Rokubacteria bacterium]
MTRYLAARFVQSLLVILGVLFLVFVILQLTGDPASLMLPPEATIEDIERLRHQMGFDRPLPIQFLHFLAGAVRGDFGRSLRYCDQPALAIVLERFPATIELALATLAWSIPVAFVLGLVAAVRRASLAEHSAMVTALVGQSMPSFWLGLMLILIFSVNLGLLPSSGRGSLAHVVLPAVTLGGFFMARLTRLVRSGLLDVLGQDYVRTARAKGLAERVVVARHALKNAAIPIVTIIGLDVGALLGGAVITETVFAWPGVGRLAIDSIYVRDFPVVQADVFIIALAFIVINFVVDVLYTWLDPRVRLT